MDHPKRQEERLFTILDRKARNTTYKNISQARNKMDRQPNDVNNIAHNKAKGVYCKKKNELQRQSWHQKTAQLNLEKDTTKLMEHYKIINDDQTYTTVNTTILQSGKLVAGKQAANELAQSYLEKVRSR